MTTGQNPPVPSGYRLLAQAAVTPAMTAWAVKILHDSATYPMFATTTAAFGSLYMLARVEWHVPDFQNHAVHRGVTLYQRTQSDLPAPYAEGIDVSHYQPNVDWQAVAVGGVSFAFIKATEGTALVDNLFQAHWAQAKRAGVLRGAYHFFRPKLDAAAQARHFLAQLSDRGEIPPVIDVEVADGAAGAAVVQGVTEFVDLVAGSMGRAIIYTSPGLWNSLPATASVASRADLCVSQWNVLTPSTVNGWSSRTFWQASNTATVAGVRGAANVDRNRFDGSIAELHVYSKAFVTGVPGAQPVERNGLNCRSRSVWRPPPLCGLRVLASAAAEHSNGVVPVPRYRAAHLALRDVGEPMFGAHLLSRLQSMFSTAIALVGLS